MKSERSLHAVAVCPALTALRAALSLTSRLSCSPFERWKLLTVVIRLLTWVAAPLTTTWKLLVVVSGGLAASLAVQLTFGRPLAKRLPQAGLQLTVALPHAS